MSLAACGSIWLVLTVLAVRVGRRALGRGTGAFELDVAISWMASSVLMHLYLQAIDGLGIGWTRLSLGVPVVLLSLLALRRVVIAKENRRVPEAGSAWVWSLGLALPFAGIFGWAALSLRTTASDFVYHWGIKGHRFAAHRGIDWQYLELPENGFAHPDYPMLVSEQFAALAILCGDFAEPAQMLWSVWCLCLLLAVGNGALLRSGLTRAWAAVGALGIGAGLTAFCSSYFQAGGADLHIALALLAGAVLLSRARRQGRWLEVAPAAGWVAAFAASSKLEGIPFALGLLALWAWGARANARQLWKPALVAALPFAATVLPWWLSAQSHGLFQPTNLGSPNPFRWPIVQEQLLMQLSLRQWHGLPWTVFLSPLLLLSSRTRAFGLIAGAQLALYLFVYVAAPVDPVFWIVSSFPRGLLQFLPTLLFGLLVLLAPVDLQGEPGSNRNRP